MASHNLDNIDPIDSQALGLGGHLRRLREARGVPLRVVAAAVGMDQAHLSKGELGQRIPTAEQTAALARYFQQDPVELEARRIAAKFRQAHAQNPAAAKAVMILQGGVPESKKSEAPGQRPDAPDPEDGRSVIILHAD
jgi:transcriptional regulator with XRE-family HTH domain